MVGRWASVFVTVLLVSTVEQSDWGSDFFRLDHTEPDASVIEVEGRRGFLPCNTTASSKKDSVYLVLWYKKGKDKPIYSLDVRPEGDDRHWFDVSVLRNGAHFHLDPPSGLAIDEIQKSDEGLYRCRVDYLHSATKNYKINLTVYVSPKKPQIVDEHDRAIDGTTAAYKEGHMPMFTCKVFGGIPLPRVEWWMEGELIDDSWMTSRNKSLVENQLNIPALTRRNLHNQFSCRAINNNITQPVVTTVKLEMQLPPNAAVIQTKKQKVSAGFPVWISCDALGARPSANITWMLGDKLLSSNQVQMSNDGNITTNSIRVTFTKADDNKLVICEASNNAYPGAVVEDMWTLNVLYPPTATTTFSKHLINNSLEEGQTVIFYCKTKAKPPVHFVRWTKNGDRLKLNTRITVKNGSLVINRLKWQDSGQYGCTAKNNQGTARSTPVSLHVLCKFIED